MMNLVDLQDKLKSFSEEQLVGEMQMPTGQLPQFLVLSEITRRQKMRDSLAQQEGQEQTTVAQDAIATAGMPAEFAGQMAAGMAPQTDMMGNTGAMPQQDMMPEQGMPQAPPQMPVQGMAGGGIVALQQGGSVGRGQPRLVVSGGRQFIEMPDGSLIPPEELGFTASDIAGAGMGDLATPSPMERSDEVNPSFREDRLEVAPQPVTPPLDFLAPSLGAVGAPPSLPSMGASPMPTVGGISAPRGDMREQGALQPVLQGVGSQPFMSPAITAAQGDPMSELQEYLGEAGEGFPVAESISGVDAAPTPSGRRSRETPGVTTPGQALQGVLPERFMEDIRSTAAVLSPFASPEDRATAAGALGAQTSGTPLTAPEDPMDLLPPREDGTRAGSAPQPPAGPGTGGIAAIGGAPGAGAAGATPSSFEQELLDMMASREKRAEQDKWLALAQFGLQLMGSSSPTLGGAIGEAGVPALEAFRTGRESADADRLGLLSAIEQSRMGEAELQLKRQAAAARAASGSSKPVPAAVLTAVNRQISDLQEQLPAAMGAPARRDAIEKEIQRLNAISNQVLSTYGLGGSFGEDDYDFMTQ
jgi:hypothetical protein